jgi:hypothetical protein
LATGIGAPTALPLDVVGVSLLANANLPTPTDPAWSIVAQGFSGAIDTLADPRPDGQEVLGLLGPSYDLIVHNRIHVIPRNYDLGAVISEQEIEVEVWNAYLTRAKTLDEITITGPSGITVVDHLGLPADIAATESEVFVVQISAEGAPQIDNVVTWVFLDIEETGTTLWLVGFRLIPFPFEPNMGQPVTETFGYLTNVITAFSSMEQRVQLREVPVGTISYAVVLNDSRTAQMAGAMLFGNQTRAFGVARWPFRETLTQAVAVDDVDVYCTTENVPFVVGGLVMFWTDPFTWEVQTIESIAADHLVLTTGARNAWAAVATTVVPMVVGRLSNNETITWESLKIATQKPTFDIDGYTP